MYFIQFRLQFFLLILTFYTRNSDYQSHAIASMGARRGGGGKNRPSPPPSKKKVLWLYWGPFCYFFFICGPFLATYFSFSGAFSPCGGLFATFYFMVRAFFGACPPPLQKFLLAPMIARSVREHTPRKFFV